MEIQVITSVRTNAERHCLADAVRFAAVAIALFAALVGVAAAQPLPPGIDGITFDGEKIAPYRFDADVRTLPAPLRQQVNAPAKSVRPLRAPPAVTKVPLPGTISAAPSIPPGLLAPMPSPTQNFAGLNFTDACTGGQCGGGWPPDPNGDVGVSHYIQAVNDAYAIYSKTGTLLASFTEDQLWATTGSNPCNGNSFGDPIVVYDALADRWILSHFAFALNGSGTPISPFFQCIAVSQTSDPVSGGWYFYPLRMDPGGGGQPPVGTLNDYAKFGIWNNCLFMAANGFNAATNAFVGSLFASFSRIDMYNGAPLTWSLGILSASGPFTMIPSNLTGLAAALLPAGTPNYFVSESQTLFAFEVRKFTAGPNCGAGGTLSSATNVSQASYALSSSSNIPQPNTTIKLDNLEDRLLQKVQYRKIGAGESLWVVHNVQNSPPFVTVRPQWAQLDVTNQVIAATPVQQQIYAPDTTLFRWMGSLAVDGQGNMALGYSTSSGTAPNFPSIAYSGRLAGDPLNTLPQTETQLVAGGGSQTNNCGGSPCDRWGDYTAMSVDPVDDCTFWYTNQYYSNQTNGSNGNWQTRIGSFKFSSCGPSPPGAPTAVIAIAGNTSATVSFTPPASSGSSPITGYTVTSNPAGGFDVNAGSVATTHTVTGLTNGISYTFTVRATNSVGTGPPSAPSNSVIPFAPSPPQVIANIIYVAQTGGDHASIQSAINAAAASASAINPVLIRIAPGVYFEQVTLKDYVDVEGSGPNVTQIAYGGVGGTVITGAQSEMRNLSVVNLVSASNPGANAILQTSNTPAGSTRLSNVKLVADGAADNLAVNVLGGTLTLVGSDVQAAPSGTQTTLEVGIFASGATASVIFKNGSLSASAGSPQNSARRVSGATIKIENAQLAGATFGTPLCFRTFDANYNAVACP